MKLDERTVTVPGGRALLSSKYICALQDVTESVGEPEGVPFLQLHFLRSAIPPVVNALQKRAPLSK
jgi:hypothetical protein